jgi:hypothetical protein
MKFAYHYLLYFVFQITVEQRGIVIETDERKK